MLRFICKKLGLVVAGLIIGITSYSQTYPQDPTNLYSNLPGGTNLGTATVVCPSSDNVFQVEVNNSDPGASWFEWVVFGGTVIDNNGSVPANNASYGLFGTIPYFYISHDNYSIGTYSTITVQWHSVDVSQAWVAVRQHSEWGCYEGTWQVVTNDIFNQQPVIDIFPADITIPFDSWLNFVLPLPGASDDGCISALTYSYTVSGASTIGPVTADAGDPSRTVNLGVGDNLVTWTISDGQKQVVQSYTITVDPDFEILNVAWLNPSCALNNGAAQVTSVTTMAANGNRVFAVEYSFDGSATWQASPFIGGLAPGTHTVRARMTYTANADLDADLETFTQTSELYSFELHGNATTAALNIPTTAPDAVVKNTSCLNSSDGAIYIGRSTMAVQDSSLVFNGANSYVMLNKNYNGTNSPLSALTVAAWVRTTADGGTILSFDNNNYYSLGLSNGRAQFASTAGTATVSNVSYNINNGQWHLVVATFGSSEFNIYVDGVLALNQAAGNTTIGTGITRYGMIGALSSSEQFGSWSYLGEFFYGQIAEVGIWDGATLTQADVTAMFTNGISTLVGATDHWMLNDLPVEVSPSSPAVFTDVVNGASVDNWGRLNQLSTLAPGPVIFSWQDAPNVGTLTRENLPVGTYTLNVKNISGCGGSTATQLYTVNNGDSEEPVVLWNAAFEKTVTASSDPSAAMGLACDGLYSTGWASSIENQPWWMVNLNNNFSVYQVRFTPSADMTNVHVMLSATALNGATLGDDLGTAGIDHAAFASVTAGTTYTANFASTSDIVKRFVKIRSADNLSLQLSEVEVLTNYRPATIRRLYITDDCEYEITSNDATINPVVFDECGGTYTLDGNSASPVLSALSPFTSLHGINLPVGSYSVTWTATDDKGLVSTLDMTYDVLDRQRPYFVENPFTENPFATVPANLTYCQAQGFEFPIARVADNYFHCEPLSSLTLHRNGVWLAYTYPNMATYPDFIYGDPNANPGSTGVLTTHMLPGNQTFEWRAVDANGNSASVSHTIHIELQPILREVKVSPISCNGLNDGTIYFSKFDSEPSGTIEYILRLLPLTSGVEYTFSSPQIPTTSVPPGSYKAYIRVNGCESNAYINDIVISNPAPINPNPLVTNVKCFGDYNGGITLNSQGGSQTNILHLWGDAQATAASYAALGIDSAGMIECWFFLDSLANGGWNWNADLFGVGNSYGLRITNGTPTFYLAGTAPLSAGTVAQREWTHIAGSFSWSDITGTETMTLYINGTAVGTQPLAADPAAASAGVYMGYNGNGYLLGFVRNARVWRIPMPAYFGPNTRIVNPIDPNNNLVASYPVNEAGGTLIYNAVSTGTNATVSGTSVRRKFAYLWRGTSGITLPFARDIANQPTGDYTVTMYDPLGCTHTQTISIAMDDDDPPTMTFFSDRLRNTTLNVGEPVVRSTSDDSGGGNVTGDCYYFPYTYGSFLQGEFDPVVSDGDCPAAGVDVTFTTLTGSDPYGTPAPAPGASSLNGVAMTGIITVEWRAEDQNGLYDTEEVTYYIVDDEPPTPPTISDSTRYTDAGSCDFTVPPGRLRPIINDQCGTGRLYNNINGTDNLDGEVFEPGTYTITWTYEDRDFPGYENDNKASVTMTLTIEDQQGPQALCQADFDSYLDYFGINSISYLDIDNNSSDNCGNLAEYHLGKNILAGSDFLSGVASTPVDGSTCSDGSQGTADKAADGNTDPSFNNCSVFLSTRQNNPSWTATFISPNTYIYGVTLYAAENGVGDALTNVDIMVSNHPAFLTETTTISYTGPAITTSQFIPLTSPVLGKFVRVQMTGNNRQLALAEVEVFGNSLSESNTLELRCGDIRYTPNVNPLVKGTFAPMPVRLIVVDNEGNSASCVTNITVIDNDPPDISTKNFTVPLGPTRPASVNANLYVNDINDGTFDASDECGTLTYRIEPPILTCNNIGTTGVTFYALDAYGNSTSAPANITIADVTPPAYTLRPNIVLPLDADGQYTIRPQDIFTHVEDNCTDSVELFYSFSPSVVHCSDIGYIDLTVTITDGNGQVATVVFDADDPVVSRRVQVADLMPPVASLSNFVLTIPEDGDSMIRFQDLIGPTSLYDNCDKYAVPTKLIRYTGSGEWCSAGSEGTGNPGAFTDITSSATAASNPAGQYSTNYLSYINNGSANDGNAYVSSSYSTADNRYVTYTFGQQYQFNSSQVEWNVANYANVTDISHNSSYLNVSNITSNLTVRRTGFIWYTYYYLSYCVDNNVNNSFESDETGTNARQDYWVSYQFSNPMVVTEIRLYWRYNVQVNNYQPFIEYSNDGTSWTTLGNIGTSTTDYNVLSGFTPFSARYVRVHFDTPNDTRAGIREWFVSGYPGTTIEYNCILPSAATLEYNNGGTWSPVLTTPAGGAVTTNGYPSLNQCDFSIINTDAFRLRFNTSTNGYVGIREWRVFGREIPTSGNEACTKYTCADVNSWVPVWLQWEDSHGNRDSVRRDVWVEPYFNIKDVILKDCGFWGQRYYPIVENVKQNVSTTYIWHQTTAYPVQGLFADPGNVDTHHTVRFWGGANQPTTYPTYTTRTLNSPPLTYCNNPTGLENNPRKSQWENHGDFSLNLEVVDDNGCWDDYDYTFRWLGDAGTLSVKPWEACVGDTVRFDVLFQEPFTFWREDYNWFVWEPGDGCYQVVGGGTSSGGVIDQIGTPPTSVGDSYIDVVFDQPTEPGETCDVVYSFKGRQFRQTAVTSPSVLTGPASFTGGAWTLEVIGEMAPGGPYWVADNALQNQTFTSGQRYVRVSGNTWADNDYNRCLEGLSYETTVYAVETPVIQALDRYNTVVGSNGGWVDASSIQVCARDTIWYRVQNIDDDYVYFEWDIMRYADITGDGVIDTIPTGRRLAQGNSYDDSIQIVWDQHPESPRLTVSGYNALDCSSTPALITHSYTDVNPPVLDCVDMDTTHVTAAGQCGFTFQNLPPPLMTDDCRDRILDFWCDVDTASDGTVEFKKKNAQGYYPVGTHTVSWYATDYSGNTSPACEQTIVVEDKQAPEFNKVPNNVTLYAGATGVAYFTATSHDLTATDNCFPPTVEARIDMGNNASWDYTGLTQLSDGSSARPFPMGVSLVEWTATDAYTNSSTVSFTVTVADTVRPVISALPDLTGTTDEPNCTHTFATIAPPADDLVSDNTTADADLVRTFVRRSDNLLNLLAPYPIGTTLITWRVTDLYGNFSERTQQVIITDDDEPGFVQPSVALQDTSISFCRRFGLRLAIPTPYDNCTMANIDSIVYRVTGGKAPGIDYVKIIPRANGVFNPNGTGLTDSIPNLYQYVNRYAEDDLGTNFIVEWWAIDKAGNRSYVEGTRYTYDLHVEIEPVFTNVQPNPMSCGGANDATITIATSPTNTDEYHFDRDHSYVPYFSIDKGSTWVDDDEFTGLRGGNYTIMMRVNNCVSEVVKTTTITEPTPYTLSLHKTDVYCFEGDTGRILLSMGGGAPGQLHFAGTGYTAAHYDSLDNILDEGAIAAWVYLDNLNPATLVSKAGSYGLSLSADSTFRLSVGASTINSSVKVKDSTWYYVAGTWDAAGMRIYVDGTLSSNTTVVSAPVNTNAVVMGTFHGILRDVSLWRIAISGSAPSNQYNGKEEGLIGFWQLNDGVGGEAKNTSSVNGWGTVATGSTALWSSVLPQPGDYTWTKNSSPHSNDIHLSGLEIGRYTVLFVDPFGCPDPITDPLTATDSIEALDKNPPLISNMGVLTVNADLNSCTYYIDQVAENDYLTPTITDESGCEFETEWQVVIDHNQVSYEYGPFTGMGDKILGAYLGRKDMNGLNTVTVTATQNVDVSSTKTYPITLNDIQSPRPDGRFDEVPDLILDVIGEVNYTAIQFNRNSADNCSIEDSLDFYLRTSSTEPWGPSIELDCDDIGTPVTIEFMVVDQSGNDSIQTGSTTFTVRDMTPPSFTLNSEPRGPYCATVDAAGGIPAYVPLSLQYFELVENIDYTDNCEVTRIRYKRDYNHPTFTGGDDADWVEIVGKDFTSPTPIEFYQGITYLWFELADGTPASVANGNTRNTTQMMVFTVTVLPKPTPASGIE